MGDVTIPEKKHLNGGFDKKNANGVNTTAIKKKSNPGNKWYSINRSLKVLSTI